MTGLAPMTHSEIKLARILLILGVIVGLPSVWETLSFSWDPTFQAPALREGPRHTNYHAFREFTLTIGALGDVPACGAAVARPLGRDGDRWRLLLRWLVAAVAVARVAYQQSDRRIGS